MNPTDTVNSKRNVCPYCHVELSEGAMVCPHCNASIDKGGIQVQGHNADEVLAVASKLQVTEHERHLANQDVKLVKMLLIGVFFVSVLFSVLGVVLVYLGSTEAMDISIFGQKMSSTGPGVAAIFLGAVLVGTTGRQLFKYVRRR